MSNAPQHATGSGSANDPTFSTAELTEMLAAARDRDLDLEPQRRIAAHEAKVQKATEFLASAKQALAAERAAQKGN